MVKRKMFAGADSLLFQRAYQLRKQQTPAEALLWNYLKTKPLGFKFRRQHPFYNYILDFYCHYLHLAIEVDGLIHEIQEIRENDRHKQAQLEDLGLTVIRFSNATIDNDLAAVIKEIEQIIELKKRNYETGNNRPKSPL